MTDFLDTILNGEAQKAPQTDRGNWLVAAPRFKDSTEAEKFERAYFEAMQDPDLLDRNPYWPVPFIEDTGKLWVSEDDKSKLEFFGVSENEYRQLYEKENPHEQIS